MLEARLRTTSRVALRDLATHSQAIVGMASELAADRATPANLDDLRRIVDTTDVNDVASCRRAQGAFLLELAALSQSARLVHEEIRLQAEFGPLLWIGLRDDDHRRRAVDAQRATIAALEAGDGERARRTIVDAMSMAVGWLLDEKSRLEEEA